MLALLSMVIACATIEQLAPPVGEQARRQAAILGVPAEDLEHGRLIYVTKCAQCHSPEPVFGYTERQWKNILPRMAKEAACTAEEAASVEAYVMITLRAIAEADSTKTDQ